MENSRMPDEAPINQEKRRTMKKNRLYFVSSHARISKLTIIHAGRIPQVGAFMRSPREQKKTAEEKPNMEEKT
jgi:hypothetical protein